MRMTLVERVAGEAMRAPARPDWARHPFARRIAHWTDFGDDDFESLERLIETEMTIRKRRELVIDGDRYRKFCLVEKGYAARYKLLRNGKRQIVNVVIPGDVVGIPSGFLERAAWSVSAVSDLKLQVFAIEDYVQLCYRRPQFGLVLSWLAVQELATLSEHITNTGRRTPAERLANFLLEIHTRLAAVGLAEPAAFELPFSQELVGDALGLSMPHLNRMFAQLQAEGLIARKARRIQIVDLHALQQLGHYQPLVLAPLPPRAAGR